MSADWYARKLAGQQGAAPRPAALPPTPVRPQYPTQESTPPMAPPSKAAHLRQEDDTCPECGSGNYFKATPNTTPRCYECGYPIVQTTSGMSSSGKGPVTPARQPSMGDGFNPTTIVDRIG